MRPSQSGPRAMHPSFVPRRKPGSTLLQSGFTSRQCACAEIAREPIDSAVDYHHMPADAAPSSPRPPRHRAADTRWRAWGNPGSARAASSPISALLPHAANIIRRPAPPECRRALIRKRLPERLGLRHGEACPSGDPVRNPPDQQQRAQNEVANKRSQPNHERMRWLPFARRIAPRRQRHARSGRLLRDFGAVHTLHVIAPGFLARAPDATRATAS